jgi:outer membrane protein assembly factor BamB
MCLPRLVRQFGYISAFAFLSVAAAHAQADGSRKWAFSTSAASVIAGNIVSSPAIGPDGTIYVGTEIGASSSASPAGKLFAITPSGAQKWVFPTNDWIDSTPAVAVDGTIYFGCWNGTLYALNADGTQKWATDLGSYTSASPAIGADGTIYIGTGAGNLYAVNPNGSVKWIFPTLYWIEASPAVAPDGTIYIGSDDNAFYAVAPDGTEKWHYVMGNDVTSSAAIAADGTVYVGSRDLKLYAFTPDGTLKWTFQTTDMIEASPVLTADGTVYIATVGGRIFALQPDGTQKWQYPAASQPALGSIYSTPAVRSDGSLVVGTSDNKVICVSSAGSLVWSAPTNDWVDSSPVIAGDNAIYVGSTDKNLYALNGTVGQYMTDWPSFLRSPQRNGYQPLGAAAGLTGRLMNLSVRTGAGSGDNTLTVGFNLGGSGNRSILVRAVGPTLSAFGLGGVLADPVLDIVPLGNSMPTASNDNWQDANGASIASTGNSLGAFPLPSDSADAAILANFSATGGAQTAQVTGKGGASGLALVELYDAGGAASAQLINLSARSFVGTGGNVLIAGFVIDGTRSLLIRGIGPTLANYGLSGTLAQPQLRLFRSAAGQQTVVADNTVWSSATNSAAIKTTGSALFAFPLANGSADCAFLVTLPAGSYSAQVSGISNTTGVGMIEVYEVP